MLPWMLSWSESDAAALVVGEGCGLEREAGRNIQHSTLSRGEDQVGFVDCGWLHMLSCLKPGVSGLVVRESYGWGSVEKQGGWVETCDSQPRLMRGDQEVHKYLTELGSSVDCPPESEEIAEYF